MAKNFIIEQLKREFINREVFTREELFDFYRQFEPDLKETTFRWRIFQLKEKKLIASLSRGLFTLTYKPIFKPLLEDPEKKLYTKIEKQFPTLRQCIWSTKLISEFMLHLPGRFLTILEVENNALGNVFNFLKDNNFRDVYLQPEEKELEYYIANIELAIILKPLISKAPTQKLKKISTITIEKMIVDLYCETSLFNVYQGNELIHIINNCYDRYSIDFTKLFGYAKRRRKEIDLMDFLSVNTTIPKILLND